MSSTVPADIEAIIQQVSANIPGQQQLRDTYNFMVALQEDGIINAINDKTFNVQFEQPITANANVTNTSIAVTNAILNDIYDTTYNAVNTIPQDPEYISFNLYLSSTLASTTLANNVAIDGTTVNVTSATGITTGKTINIRQDNRFFQSLITNVSGTTITLASPLDYAFTSGAFVRVGDYNLAQNGSVTPVTFRLQPPPNAKFHITAISITMTDDATMDNSKFGSVNALTKGLLARRIDGTDSKVNLFLITNNAGFYQFGYDTDYPAKVPSGVYSFDARKKFRDANGNVISLNGATNGEVQIIVRDDLSSITEFTVQVHGHITTP